MKTIICHLPHFRGFIVWKGVGETEKECKKIMRKEFPEYYLYDYYII